MRTSDRAAGLRVVETLSRDGDASGLSGRQCGHLAIVP